jgi:RNA polymerase sigma-70 factor (sigma-E family)
MTFDPSSVTGPPNAPIKMPSLPPAEPMPGALDLRHAEREAAVTRLFESHATELTRLAALLGAGADADDVVAEAFCDLHRRWGRLRDPDAAPAYLRSAVCNLTRMRLRHLQVVRRHAPEAPPDVSSPESEVILREDQQQVVRALRSLPNRQREALVLRYWLDLREADVAQAMGISTGSVKVHTSRGMAALTKALRGIR